MEEHYKEAIIINATALDSSGALSIISQFIKNIPLDNHKWLVFTSENVKLESESLNVRIVSIKGVKPMHKRFLWDTFGLKRWLEKNKVEPIASVSLQNTGFRVGKKVPSFVYYHQSIPFFPYKWNILKREERTMWFYKHIYPFFVKLFLRKETKVYVQLAFIKHGFIKKFKHPNDNVEIYSPSVMPMDSSKWNLNLNNESLNLFYPATAFFYKNHRVIIDAIRNIKTDVKLYVTTNQFGGCKNVVTLGSIPFSEVCSMYNQCDALLFPSYIETFGLPLLEAAMVGLPIIAADLPYAREVLDGYDGVTFVPYNEPNAWEKSINEIIKGKRYRPFDISYRPGWPQLIESIITNL